MSRYIVVTTGATVIDGTSAKFQCEVFYRGGFDDLGPKARNGTQNTSMPSNTFEANTTYRVLIHYRAGQGTPADAVCEATVAAHDATSWGTSYASSDGDGTQNVDRIWIYGAPTIQTYYLDQVLVSYSPIPICALDP